MEEARTESEAKAEDETLNNEERYKRHENECLPNNLVI